MPFNAIRLAKQSYFKANPNMDYLYKSIVHDAGSIAHESVLIFPVALYTL